MDGKVILPGFIVAGIAIATILLGWMAKLKLIAQIWSKAKSVMSVIARLFKKDSPPPPSGGIAAGDNASLRGNVVAGRDAKVDQSHRTRVSNFFQIFNMTPTHDREHKQRTARRRNVKGSGKDVDESSGAVSEENPHPGLPPEPDKADNRPTADQPATTGSNNRVNATLPIVGSGRPDASEGVKSDRPAERSVVYEDDSDVSRMGNADERDLYLEAVEGLALMASPSGQVMGPNWPPIDSVGEFDNAEANEATSLSENATQASQEVGVLDMDVSPAEVSQHNTVNEPSTPDISSLPLYSEVDGESIPPDSAMIQDFSPPKLEEAKGSEASYPRNSGDHEPVLEDELAAILRSYPLVAIGKVLRSRRIEVTISQPDINYDRGWVSQLEQGSFSLTPEALTKQKARLRRYLRVIGWTPEMLLAHLTATK